MDHARNSHRSAIPRRQFLQSVVMGAAAVQLAPALQPGPPGAEEVEIVSGPLLAWREGWLEILEDNRSRRFAIDAETSFWKGGESLAAALREGDDVMIRGLAPSGRAVRVWSNLSRVSGLVVGAVKSGYVLRIDGLHAQQSETVIEVGGRTLFGDILTYGPAGRGGSVVAQGDYVDAIGEQLSDRQLRATLAYVHRPGRDAVGPSAMGAEQAPDRVDASVSSCTYTFSGYAGWFNCSTGAGRCGTCNTSFSTQAAWPAMDTCGCCSWNCCDCSRNCKNQIRLSCGKGVSVRDLCQSRSRTVYIVDCGPCQKANCSGCSPELCGRKCSDCRGNVGAVIDLTRPTFAYFYDPASRGCFSCDVSVTLPPPCPTSVEPSQQ